MPRKIINEYKDINHFIAFFHDKNCFRREIFGKKIQVFKKKLIFSPLCVLYVSLKFLHTIVLDRMERLPETTKLRPELSLEVGGVCG